MSNEKTSKKLGPKMAAQAWVTYLGRQNCLTQWFNMASLKINSNCNSIWASQPQETPELYNVLQLKRLLLPLRNGLNLELASTL